MKGLYSQIYASALSEEIRAMGNMALGGSMFRQGKFFIDEKNKSDKGEMGADFAITIEKIRQASHEAREVFAEMLEDFWIRIVQVTAINGPPAERRTLFASSKVGTVTSVTVGWYNYPGGMEAAFNRFAWRLDLWKGGAEEIAKKIFTANLNPSDSTKAAYSYREANKILFQPITPSETKSPKRTKEYKEPKAKKPRKWKPIK